MVEGQPDEVNVKQATSKVNGRFREIRGRGEEGNLEKSVCIDLFRKNKDLRRYAGGRRVQKDHACDKYMREKVQNHGEPKSRKKRELHLFHSPARWRRLRRTSAEFEVFESEQLSLDQSSEEEADFENGATKERSLFCLLDFMKRKSHTLRIKRRKRTNEIGENHLHPFSDLF